MTKLSDIQIDTIASEDGRYVVTVVATLGDAQAAERLAELVRTATTLLESAPIAPEHKSEWLTMWQAHRGKLGLVSFVLAVIMGVLQALTAEFAWLTPFTSAAVGLFIATRFEGNKPKPGA